MNASTISSIYRIFSVFLQISIPFMVFRALRPWRPKTRRSYSLKFSMWPFIFFSHVLGQPIARYIWYGDSGRWGMNFVNSLQGLIGLGVLLAPFAFVIGYFIAKKKFK